MFAKVGAHLQWVWPFLGHAEGKGRVTNQCRQDVLLSGNRDHQGQGSRSIFCRPVWAAQGEGCLEPCLSPAQENHLETWDLQQPNTVGSGRLGSTLGEGVGSEPRDNLSSLRDCVITKSSEIASWKKEFDCIVCQAQSTESK